MKKVMKKAKKTKLMKLALEIFELHNKLRSNPKSFIPYLSKCL